MAITNKIPRRVGKNVGGKDSEESAGEKTERQMTKAGETQIR